MAVGPGSRGSSVSVRPPSEIWNGHSWRLVLMQGLENAISILNGIACSSSSACTAAGDYVSFSSKGKAATPALLERWNGVRWRIQVSAVKQDDIFAVSCLSRFDRTAVGAVYRGFHDQQSVEVVQTWHGSSWRRDAVVSRQHAALYGVACGAASCLAVGVDDIPVTRTGTFVGRTLVQVGGGKSWVMQSTPSVAHARRALYFVACTTGQACIAVGVRSDKLLVERN